MRHGSTGKDIVFPPDTILVCVGLEAVEESLPIDPVGKKLKVGNGGLVGKVKGGGGTEVVGVGRVKGGGIEEAVVGGGVIGMEFAVKEVDDDGNAKVTPSVVITCVGYGSVSLPITMSLGSKMTVGPENGSVIVVSVSLRVMVFPSTTIVRDTGICEKLTVIPSEVRIPLPVPGKLIV